MVGGGDVILNTHTQYLFVFGQLIQPPNDGLLGQLQCHGRVERVERNLERLDVVRDGARFGNLYAYTHTHT